MGEATTPLPWSLFRVSWAEYQDKAKDLADPLHRLKWCVELTYLDWSKATAGEKLDIAAGLLALMPELAGWQEDDEGCLWGLALPDEYVLGIQERLKPLFAAIAEGSEPVELTTYPVRMTWHPPLIVPEADMCLPRRVCSPQVMIPRSRVIREHEHGLNGVELAVYCVGTLLHQCPDSLQRCPAPRTRRMKHDRPECGNIFVALHSSRRYCSQRCAARSSR